MSDALRSPLHGVAVYNPKLLGREELIGDFVARRPLLERLLEDLRHEPPGRPPQHHLIVGQRGMGKTTLLHRLRYAIEDDTELGPIWMPLVFPEEQYNVARLSDLWLNCLDALSDGVEARGDHAAAEKLDDAVEALGRLPDDQLQRKALELLLEHTRHDNRRLVLLLDNLDLILERLKDDHWALREILSAEPGLLIVGTSVEHVEAAFQYDKAFYDFFRVHELRGLSEEEVRTVLLRLAERNHAEHVTKLIQEHPERIAPLSILTGGNPRTSVLIYDILALSHDGDLQSNLESLLDRCTPLYKARFESLAPQAQQVLDALALHWHPITPLQLANDIRLRLDNRTVSMQLDRLFKAGIVERVKAIDMETREPARGSAYQIAERFFNIWYLMRASRRMRKRLLWLVEFLRIMHTPDELRDRAKRQLELCGLNARDELLRRAEYQFALADALDDIPYRMALQHASLRDLQGDAELRKKIPEFIDGEEEPQLQSRADHMKRMADLRQAILDAEVDWGDWSAEDCWKLLGGEPSLSIIEKEEKVAKLSVQPHSQLMAALAKVHNAWGTVLDDSRSTEALYEAFRQGLITDLQDAEGVAAAALIFNCPRLEAFFCHVRASQVEAPATKEKEYNSACKIDPSWPQSWILLGAVLLDQSERISEAEAAFRQATVLAPSQSNAWLGLGDALVKQQRLQEADDAFAKVTELAPDDASMWRGLGWIRLGQDRFEEAEVCFRRVIELEPEGAVGWQLLRLAHYRQQKFSEYVPALRQSLAQDPNGAYRWRLLAESLQLPIQRNEAVHAYQKAIELEPSNPHAYNAFAWLLYSTGENLEQAESSAQTAVTITPDNLLYTLTLAVILAARGKWLEAHLTARKLLSEGTDSFFDERWPLITLFFREAVQTGHAGDAITLLDECNLGERWIPLREALLAAKLGSRDALGAMAPEIRHPAEKLLDQLLAEKPGRGKG